MTAVFQANVFQNNVFQVGGTGQNIQPSLYVDPDTFFSPHVTLPGSSTLVFQPNIFQANVFQVGGLVALPHLFVDTDTFYSPKVGGGTSFVTPAKFPNTNVFFVPAASSKYGLLPSAFVNPNTFPAPTAAIAPDPTVRHSDPTYDDTGAHIMVTSNLNDGHRLDIDSGYLMGRTSAGRGPAQAISIGGVLSSTSATFAGLPGSPTAGTISQVTDSTVNTPGATVAGGGSHHILAWFNGTAWTVIGV